jgi:hypothetical protein
VLGSEVLALCESAELLQSLDVTRGQLRRDLDEGIGDERYCVVLLPGRVKVLIPALLAKAAGL